MPDTATTFPPPGWTVEDCLAWLGSADAGLDKRFSPGEARDAVGRWVVGGAGATKAGRRKASFKLLTRPDAQRAVKLKAKRTLHGEAYEVDGHAVHAADEGQDEKSFKDDLAASRHEDQQHGKAVLEAHVDEDDDEASLKEKLMDSYDADRRNKPGWLSGRAAVEDRKHVENAVDDYLAAGNADQGFEDGEVLHVSVARSAGSRFHSARDEHERHLRSQGMKDGEIDKELSGEADEARDKAKQTAAVLASNMAWSDSEGDLAQAYPEEHKTMLAMPTVHARAGAREKLTRRFTAEHGRKPGAAP